MSILDWVIAKQIKFAAPSIGLESGDQSAKKDVEKAINPVEEKKVPEHTWTPTDTSKRPKTRPHSIPEKSPEDNITVIQDLPEELQPMAMEAVTQLDANQKVGEELKKLKDEFNQSIEGLNEELKTGMVKVTEIAAKLGDAISALDSRHVLVSTKFRDMLFSTFKETNRPGMPVDKKLETLRALLKDKVDPAKLEEINSELRLAELNYAEANKSIRRLIGMGYPMSKEKIQKGIKLAQVDDASVIESNLSEAYQHVMNAINGLDKIASGLGSSNVTPISEAEPQEEMKAAAKLKLADEKLGE